MQFIYKILILSQTLIDAVDIMCNAKMLVSFNAKTIVLMSIIKKINSVDGFLIKSN